MHDSVRYKLHFGPYRTPRFRYGQKVLCEVRGEVTICGTTAAPIAWPIGRIGPLKSLVVYRGLANAIRQESIQAVAHHWGITTQTVTKWRRRLGIKGEPLGTSILRTRHFEEPWAEETRKKAWAKARDPVRREKIAAAKRGKPRPKHVIEILRKANLGRKHTEEARRKMSIAQRVRGAWPPAAGRPWEPWENELVRTLSRREAATRTGRTEASVKGRRQQLRRRQQQPA